MSCSVEGCYDPVFSECKGERGGYTYTGPLCKRHYSKLARRGDPTLGRAKRKDAGTPRFRVGGCNSLYVPEVILLVDSVDE